MFYMINPFFELVLIKAFFLLYSVITGCTDGIGKAYTHEVQWTYTTAVVTFPIVDT